MEHRSAMFLWRYRLQLSDFGNKSSFDRKDGLDVYRMILAVSRWQECPPRRVEILECSCTGWRSRQKITLQFLPSLQRCKWPFDRVCERGYTVRFWQTSCAPFSGEGFQLVWNARCSRSAYFSSRKSSRSEKVTRHGSGLASSETGAAVELDEVVENNVDGWNYEGGMTVKNVRISWLRKTFRATRKKWCSKTWIFSRHVDCRCGNRANPGARAPDNKMGACWGYTSRAALCFRY